MYNWSNKNTIKQIKLAKKLKLWYNIATFEGKGEIMKKILKSLKLFAVVILTGIIMGANVLNVDAVAQSITLG